MTEKTKQKAVQNKGSNLIFKAQADLSISHFNLYIEKGKEISLNEKQQSQLKPQIDAGLLVKA